MNLYQFSLLDLKEKEIILFQQGVLLAARQEDEYIFELYQYNSYYVEFIYLTNIEGNMAVRCFTSIEELKPYIEKIDISSITGLKEIDN